LVNEANLILLGRAYWFLLPSRRNREAANAASHGYFLEQWSHAPLLQCSVFFFFLINEKSLVFFFRTTPVQLIVDNIFFLFF
jgi:hypothetical protein